MPLNSKFSEEMSKKVNLKRLSEKVGSTKRSKKPTALKQNFENHQQNNLERSSILLRRRKKEHERLMSSDLNPNYIGFQQTINSKRRSNSALRNSKENDLDNSINLNSANAVHFEDENISKEEAENLPEIVQPNKDGKLDEIAVENIDSNTKNENSSQKSLSKKLYKYELPNSSKKTNATNKLNETIIVDMESEIPIHEIKTYKNTPIKFRNPQVILHKSPQIERMQRNRQIRTRRQFNLSKAQIIDFVEIVKDDDHKIHEGNLINNLSTELNFNETNHEFCNSSVNYVDLSESLRDNGLTKVDDTNESSNSEIEMEHLKDFQSISCDNGDLKEEIYERNLNKQVNNVIFENDKHLLNVNQLEENIKENKTLNTVLEPGNTFDTNRKISEINNNLESTNLIATVYSEDFVDKQPLVVSENETNAPMTKSIELINDNQFANELISTNCDSSHNDLLNLNTVENRENIVYSEEIPPFLNPSDIVNSELALENNLIENENFGMVSSTDEAAEILNITKKLLEIGQTNNVIVPAEIDENILLPEKEGVESNKVNKEKKENEDILNSELAEIEVDINEVKSTESLFGILDQQMLNDIDENLIIQNQIQEFEKNLFDSGLLLGKEDSKNADVCEVIMEDKILISAGPSNSLDLPINTKMSDKTDLTANLSSDSPTRNEESVIVSKTSEITDNVNKELPQKLFSNAITETQTMPDSESLAFTLLSNARNTKSPLSTDSARGSSIDVETNFHPKFGEIFWARISKYPFWPCIVWTDPEGKTISIGMNGHRQHIRIHVRFFADNGRRSWVRKEDLMAYNGREDFELKKDEFFQKNNVNKKNNIARAFLIPQSKKYLWDQAIDEATLVLNEHIEKRSEKFMKILDETRLLTSFDRKRKLSIARERRFSMYSITGSEDIFSNSLRGSSLTSNRKRDRSPTPESPAFENVDDFKTFVKKRKINLQSQNDITTSNSNLYESAKNEIDFTEFSEIIKSFVLPVNEDENMLYKSLKEIWEIKLRSDVKRNHNQIDENNRIENGLKRVSTRVSTLQFRRSLPAIMPQSHTTVQKEKVQKIKKESLPIEEVVNDIYELNKNYLFKDLKKESVCKVCLQPGGLYRCSGSCQNWIHQTCVDFLATAVFPPRIPKTNISVPNKIDRNMIPHVSGDSNELSEENINKDNIINIAEASLNILCKECKDELPPICFVCKQNETIVTDDSKNMNTLLKCNMTNCSKYYHIDCLKYWPQARLTKSKGKIDRFICPSHTCQTCISDDPKGKFLKLQSCTRCVLCPASYHTDSTCIPAGAKILTVTDLICPRHRSNKLSIKLNTNWCFICCDGGNLICCESCPTSFHLECLNIEKLPDAGYICEECETGRMPLYGEMIWAKFGVHKWWPCITIPPPQIPKNLLRLKRREFDFCVRFFGTNDYSWISRDRVFLYQEDDWRYSSKSRSNDKDFSKALEDAKKISEMLKSKKTLKKEDEKKILLVPSPYKRIQVNRPVPPVKLPENDTTDAFTPCDCGTDDKVCDAASLCVNRLLMIECNSKICPAGDKCKNQMFENRTYAPVRVERTSGKGFGLISEDFIPAGTFVIEYVGELIDDNELKRRILQKQEEKDENYYFLTMQHGLIIDAGPKGNLARFMNHSCEPNCETQKWNVNGNTRIGLFTICDVEPNVELTFNYNLECVGDDKKSCFCGAQKCSGFIGAKYKKTEKKDNLTSDVSKQLKTRRRSKKSIGNAISDSSSISKIP